jgi:hypothetical protein
MQVEQILGIIGIQYAFMQFMTVYRSCKISPQPQQEIARLRSYSFDKLISESKLSKLKKENNNELLLELCKHCGK